MLFTNLFLYVFYVVYNHVNFPSLYQEILGLTVLYNAGHLSQNFNTNVMPQGLQMGPLLTRKQLPVAGLATCLKRAVLGNVDKFPHNVEGEVTTHTLCQGVQTGRLGFTRIILVALRLMLIIYLNLFKMSKIIYEIRLKAITSPLSHSTPY